MAKEEQLSESEIEAEIKRFLQNREAYYKSIGFPIITHEEVEERRQKIENANREAAKFA